VTDSELLPKSKMEPVRRLEVFTGAGRRRAWTPAQKAEIVGETYDSGETVSAVARRYGLTPQQVFGWRRKGRRGAGRQTRGDRGEANGATFAPVIVEQTQPGSDAPVPPSQDGGLAAIEIVIGAATVRVAPGMDAATLTTVLRAVKAAT
jgi:transposase